MILRVFCWIDPVLAEFLLDKGYQVHGTKRRTTLFNTDRADRLCRNPARGIAG